MIWGFEYYLVSSVHVLRTLHVVFINYVHIVDHVYPVKRGG